MIVTMRLFVLFLSGIILSTDQGHSWRIVKKNNTEAPISTTTCNCKPVLHDPRCPSFEPLMVPFGYMPAVWQLELIINDNDLDLLTNNSYEKKMKYIRDYNHWRLQPFGGETGFYDLRDLPKVVLLKQKIQEDKSKPSKSFTIGDYTAHISSFREVARPSIDDVFQTYNSHSSKAPIYIKMDLHWPVVEDNYGRRRRQLFNVVRVNY